MKTYTLVDMAYAYAEAAHKSVGQKRKYTGECYFSHPKAVASLVQGVGGDDEMIAAAYLHDVVEDTQVELRDILNLFGSRVGMLVEGLTDVSFKSDGSRAERKGIDRAHTSNQPPSTKTIKLADLIHNSYSIERYDTKFAKIYMAEKKLLLEVLKEGNSTLHARASKIVDEYYSKELNHGTN